MEISSLNNWLTYIQAQPHSKDSQLSILQGLVRLEGKNTKSERSKPHNDTLLLCGDNATSSVMLWGKHRHCPLVSPPVFTICYADMIPYKNPIEPSVSLIRQDGRIHR